MPKINKSFQRQQTINIPFPDGSWSIVVVPIPFNKEKAGKINNIITAYSELFEDEKKIDKDVHNNNPPSEVRG